MKEHTLSMDCWCRPVRDKVNPLVITHCPYGTPELLAKVREIQTEIEGLCPSHHASRMSSLISDLAFAMQQLQQNGDYYWPHRLLLASQTLE